MKLINSTNTAAVINGNKKMLSDSTVVKYLSQVSNWLYLSGVILCVAESLGTEKYVKNSEIIGSLVKLWDPIVIRWTSTILFLALLIDVLINGLNIKKMFFAIIGSLLLMEVFVNKNETYQLNSSFWLIVSYPENLNIKKPLKAIYITGLFMSLIIIGSALMGTVDNTLTFYHNTLRYSLGFTNPNDFSIKIAFIIAVWMLESTYCWKPIYYPLALGLGFLSFAYGDGQMSIALILTFTLGIALYRLDIVPNKIKVNLKKVLNTFCIIGFPLFAIGSLLLVYLLSTWPNVASLTGSLGGRIKNWVDVYQTYGFTLLGRKININHAYDNYYLYIATFYGLLNLIFFSFIFIYFGIYLRNQNRYEDTYFLILFTAILLVFFLGESTGRYLINNPLILYLGYMIKQSPYTNQVTPHHCNHLTCN